MHSETTFILQRNGLHNSGALRVEARMPNNLIRGNKAHHCWLSSDLQVCELETFVNVDPNILVAR